MKMKNKKLIGRIAVLTTLVTTVSTSVFAQTETVTMTFSQIEWGNSSVSFYYSFIFSWLSVGS